MDTELTLRPARRDDLPGARVDAELPARAVCNVSLDPAVWRYLGNDQPTPLLHRGR
jgi:hypothetical protein